MTRVRSLALGAFLCAFAIPAAANAFCGFYVGGVDGKLFNNATQVTLMRDGTRTVLSMQNNYQGPPANFAMVVPVPVILQKENVKTLPLQVFTHLEALAGPRLVEYWEEDPCYIEPPRVYAPMASARGGGMESEAAGKGHGVKIEAQFSVGEYDIVILSAKDGAGLDAWLHEAGYKIPDGAGPVLRPYVEAGMKFFVAKVDVTKVKMDGNQAMLSPLRFFYDSDKFSLPVRLGLLSSSGTQDLIVNILARGQRYEVANYPNVQIPTNIDVANATRDRFGEFYAALFDATLERNKGAVVTEYSWDAKSCDPCPTPPLAGNDLATLGADSLPGVDQSSLSYGGGFTLTRLHARYSKDTLGEDLIFKAAPPIIGGREGNWQGNGTNMFQARYAIRHEWTGPIACKEPIRHRWIGTPPATAGGGGGRIMQPMAATNLAFAPRGQLQLASFVQTAVPEVGVQPAPKTAPVPPPSAPPVNGKAQRVNPENNSDTAACAVSLGDGGTQGALILLAVLLGMAIRRSLRKR